jgi:hypothetical protein
LLAWTLLAPVAAVEKRRRGVLPTQWDFDGLADPSKRSAPMDDYQDEILEWHAAEQDGPEPADDAFEL